MKDIYKQEEKEIEQRQKAFWNEIQAQIEPIRIQNELREQLEKERAHTRHLEYVQRQKEIEQEKELKKLKKQSYKNKFEPNIAKCSVCKWKNSCTRTRCHYIYKG